MIQKAIAAVAAVVVLGMVGGVVAAQQPSNLPAEAREALDKMGSLVGGKWVGDFKDPKNAPVVEMKYEWNAERTQIRSSGTIAGAAVEARIGWDPGAKKLYYVDFHGPAQVYYGHYSVVGEQFVLDFKSIVGSAGTYRAKGAVPRGDSYESMLQAEKDGKYADLHEIRLKRVK